MPHEEPRAPGNPALESILAAMLNPIGFRDKFKIKGDITLVLAKEDGTFEVTRKGNLVLDAGFDFVSDAIGKSGSQPSAMAYIALGTGTTAVDASQTALVTELDRRAATYAHTAGTKTFTFSCTFAAGQATGALTEAGVANAASDGTFIDRVTFDVVNKGANDSLTVTFTFTLS